MAQDYISTSGDVITLGQAAMAQSLPVVLPSDQSALAVTIAALPAVGQKAKAASLPVTLASDEDTVNVDATQLPAALGQGTMAQSMTVAIASDQSAVPVSDGAGSLTVDTDQLPGTLGQKTKATALGVTLASDEDALAVTAAQLPAALGSTTSAGSVSVVPASDAVRAYTNTAMDTIEATNVLAAPTTVAHGVAITGGPGLIHLLCHTTTTGADGPVVFRVWWWFAGPNRWYLDRTFGLGADGSIDDLLLTTTEPLMLSMQAPGTRVAVEVTTSSAALTLHVTPMAVVEGA